MIKILVVTLLAILSLSCCCHSNTQKKSQLSTNMQFDCLPADIKLDAIISYGKKEITVREKLVELKAKCDNGRLIDGNKREILFFRPACFGNPPHNYDEIRFRERLEIEKLRQTHTLILMECNPMMM